MKQKIELSPKWEYIMFSYYFRKKLGLDIKAYESWKQFQNVINWSKPMPSIWNALYGEGEEYHSRHKEVLNIAKIIKFIMNKFEPENYSDFIFDYYENMILRPLYIIFNQMGLFSEMITGRNCFIMYENLFLFLKVTIKVYDHVKQQMWNKGIRASKNWNLNVIDNMSDNIRKFIIDKMGCFGVARYNYPNSVKYYDFFNLFKTFMECCGRILKDKAAEKGDNAEQSKNTNNKKYKIWYEKYNEKKHKLKEWELAFVKISHQEQWEGVMEYFYSCFICRLNNNYLWPSELFSNTDPVDRASFLDMNPEYSTVNQIREASLTWQPNSGSDDDRSFKNKKDKDKDKDKDNNDVSEDDPPNKSKNDNFDGRDDYDDYELITDFHEEKSAVDIFKSVDSFPYSNFPVFKYIIDITNENCYNTDNNQKKCDSSSFFEVILKNAIFPSILAEISKVYEIDYWSEVGNYSIFLKIAKNSLKYLQNWCEGHEQKYQNKLFSIYISKSNLRSSFLNFLIISMKWIKDTMLPETVEWRNSINAIAKKDYQSMFTIYQGITDWIVEMLQGTEVVNLKYIFALDRKNIIYNSSIWKEQSFNYQFKNMVVSVAELIFEEDSVQDYFGVNSDASNLMKSDTLISNDVSNMKLSGRCIWKSFNPVSYPIKMNWFNIINNIISQDNVPNEWIDFLQNAFPIQSLLESISILISGIYICHIMGIQYDNGEKSEGTTYMDNSWSINDGTSDNKSIHKTRGISNEENKKKSFAEEFKKINLFENGKLKKLKSKYKEIKKTSKYDWDKSSDIYMDKYFKLASQMYLYILFMIEKYNNVEYLQVLSKYREDYQQRQYNQEIQTTDKASDKQIINEFRKKKQKRLEENIQVTIEFFQSIIENIEFRFSDSEVKTIFFIVDPIVYCISKSSINKFIQEADRSNYTTKINSLFDWIELFYIEVCTRDSSSSIDHRDAVFLNFIAALLINVSFLLFVNIESSGFWYVFCIWFLIWGQLSINIALVIYFFYKKYDSYTKILKRKYSNEKEGWWKYFKIYFIDSFWMNDEIYLINFLIVLGVWGMFAKYKLLFFITQLLIVIDFVGTIKEIVFAFKIRFGQLLTMIAFLCILIYFYSNFGFYFYIYEFNTVINNVPDNYCQSLLECVILYFNFGVRSGGGIGDVLGEKEFTNVSMYLVRWFTDLIFYISVVLLLLNMINGVIVSTFAQIRESSEKKEDDMDNRCFICNIDKKYFAKKKLDFEEHKRNEHSLGNYIKYFIYLKRINEKDLDSDQSYVLKCWLKRNVGVFPLERSKKFGVLTPAEKNIENDD